MLFETPKYNYVFILSLWAFTAVLDGILRSVQPLDIANPGTPPDIVLYLPTVVYSIFGAYVGLYLLVWTYNGILGPKLEKSATNLFIYGIRSFASLALILVDLVTFIAVEHDFVIRVFHLGNTLPSWQEIFVLAGFPILGLFLTWSLRNPKLKYVVSH